MRRVLIQARQSDTRGAGAESLSLDSLERELRGRCEREGWAVVGVLREPDRKGWQDEATRPDIARALDLAREGAYDVLLTWSMDRFARSVRIQEDLVYRLARHGVDVVSHTEPHVALSPMVRQIIGAVAEETTRAIAKHTRRTLLERHRRGLPHGVVPYGWRRDPATGAYVPHPDEAPVVVELYRRFLAGESRAAIAADLSARGVPTAGRSRTGVVGWRVNTITGVLGRPAHAGGIALNGELVWGTHPGIVSREDWERAQDRLRAGLRPARRKVVRSWLEGRLRHACGAPMYLIPRRGGHAAEFRCRWTTERRRPGEPPCPIRPRSVAVSRVEPAARRVVAAAAAGLRPWREVLAEAKRATAGTDSLVARRRRDLAERRGAIEARRRRYEELYADGARDRAWFDARDAEAAAELAAIDRDLDRLPEAPDPDAYRARWERLRSLADALAGADDAAIGALLGELGNLEYGPDGLRLVARPDVAGFVATP